MAFEVYHPRKREKSNALKLGVKLSKNSLVLNKLTRQKLNNPEYIELAFDPDTNSMRVMSAGKVGGVQVKKTKVYAKGFFEHFKINKFGNYVADYNEEENAIYVKLA